MLFLSRYNKLSHRDPFLPCLHRIFGKCLRLFASLCWHVLHTGLCQRGLGIPILLREKGRLRRNARVPLNLATVEVEGVGTRDASWYSLDKGQMDSELRTVVSLVKRWLV